ncbi:MAG TPA: hydrogenase [Myxococcota bacterium]|jgi:hydroxylaminobenzene mutase
MDREQRLLRHGFALYLLGLLTGLAAYALENPRMGVAAHVEGVVNAIFLIVLGVAWPRLGLEGRAATCAYATGVVGAYANWGIPLFSAIVGASQPILAGAGFEASPWAETILRISPIGGVVAPLLCAALVLWGLHRRAAT